MSIIYKRLNNLQIASLAKSGFFLYVLVIYRIQPEHSSVSLWFSGHCHGNTMVTVTSIVDLRYIANLTVMLYVLVIPWPIAVVLRDLYHGA